MNALRTNPIRTTALVLVALLAGVFAFGFADSRNQAPAKEHAVAVDLAGTERASVTLRPEVADLTLRAAGTDAGMLLAGSVATRRGEELRERVEHGAFATAVALRSHTGMGIHMNVRGPVWDLDLAPGLPVDLRIHTEISQLDLDLRGTRVETLDVRNATGRSRVYLPTGGMSGALSTDVGDIVLYVPRDADASIAVRRGMSLVRADDAFARDGRTWRLAGTGPRIDVRVANSVGAVTLATY